MRRPYLALGTATGLLLAIGASAEAAGRGAAQRLSHHPVSIHQIKALLAAMVLKAITSREPRRRIRRVGMDRADGLKVLRELETLGRPSATPLPASTNKVRED
jgi:hypothetical protein